jgi:hypothetical protein
MKNDSYVVTEVNSSGDKIEKTLFNDKLTETLVRTIRKVLPGFDVVENNVNEVCVKMFHWITEHR